MATVTPIIPDGKKLSFAKVAASGARDNGSARVPTPVTTRPPQENTVPRPVIPLAPVPAIAAASAAVVKPTTFSKSPPAIQSSQAKTPTMAKRSLGAVDHEAMDGLGNGVNDMSLDQKTPNLVVNGTSPTATDRIGGSIHAQREGVSGNLDEKIDNNSDLGTKPPSLDGKSIASGTTFALDEKESLRPDDSASMKAAAEDDDAFSTRGSILAGSRMGSDTRAVRIQLGDMPLAMRSIPIVYEAQGGQDDGIGESSQQTQSEPKMLLDANDGATNAINNALYRQNPDEKLLEAMNSSKDRLFLLRLEKEVIEFVQNSKEPFIDLPPCNSFCRLLTHKLADYYHMTHSYEAGAGSVRIFRTPFCRVPPSLASLACVNVQKISTPPPVIMPKKIMRRGEDGNTAPTSADASKATSEAGSDSKDKSGLKDKPTREEREEAYNRAREKIFGTNEKAGESTPEIDDGIDISRASSVSAKDKTMAKRKVKRRDDNEGFETRSQYTAYYGHPHQPWQPQYVPINTINMNDVQPQFGAQVQQQAQHTFASQMTGPMYATNPAPYQGPLSSNGYQYNNGSTYSVPPAMQQSYSQPMSTNRPIQPSYAQTAPVPPMQVPSATVPTTPQPSWQQPYNVGPGSFQNRPPTAPPVAIGASPSAPGSKAPYAYGQLPAHINPNDPKSQHPIPGSYSRLHAFNPMTQSFVPGGNNAMVPLALPQGFVQGVGSHHGSPQMQSAPMYTPYSHHQQQQQFGSGGFGMARQASNSGMPPPVAYQNQPPPHMPPHPPPIQPQAPYAPVRSQASSKGPPAVLGVGNASSNYSHLPAYGNPATLPQKPPSTQRPGV